MKCISMTATIHNSRFLDYKDSRYEIGHFSGKHISSYKVSLYVHGVDICILDLNCQAVSIYVCLHRYTFKRIDIFNPLSYCHTPLLFL